MPFAPLVSTPSFGSHAGPSPPAPSSESFVSFAPGSKMGSSSFLSCAAVRPSSFSTFSGVVMTKSFSLPSNLNTSVAGS